MTEREEQTTLLTSSLFRKRPLVVTVRKLMLHLEIKLKQSKLKSLSQKTAASVKSQNLLVIQVNSNMICFPYYCLLVHL